MNAQQQVAKLQGLLARIRRNAEKPRAAAPTAPISPSAASDFLATAAPAAAVPELDVPFDSVPPFAESEASLETDAEPIPLVSSSAGAPEGDDESLESEVSEVRFTTGMRETTEVTVAAIEAEAESIAAEELTEEDLVEVTEVVEGDATLEAGDAASAEGEVDIDFEDEEPPASSQRSKVAASMDEALAAAAEQLEPEHDVPIKTPPPESGPQEAPPAGIAAPEAPDVDALLGQELDIPTREAPAGPTTEQLGQKIELEEGGGPALELAEQHHVEAPASAPAEELEVSLPGRDFGGGYDESLQPPPEALSELEAHRRRTEDELQAPPPESLAQVPSGQSGGAPSVEAPQAAPPAQGPEVVARAVPTGSPESFSSVRETFRPSSFVELLDASLALSGD